MSKDITVTRAICTSPHHKGPRWMLALYFHRRSKGAIGLQSRCKTCSRIANRHKNMSEAARSRKNGYIREYKTAQRRQAGIEPRAEKLSNPYFDSKKLVEYIDARIRTEYEVEKGQVCLMLNGRIFTKLDQRYLHHLRSGEVARTTLARVDRLAVDYDLQLWELIDAAGCYKTDKRTRSRKQMAKKRANGTGKDSSKERERKKASL